MLQLVLGMAGAFLVYCIGVVWLIYLRDYRNKEETLTAFLTVSGMCVLGVSTVSTILVNSIYLG
jgi:hypothetical protein